MSPGEGCVLHRSVMTKFEYVFVNSGKVGPTSNSFNLITENCDIKLLWKIEHMPLFKFSTNTKAPYLIPLRHEWKKITLEKFDSNFQITLRVDVDQRIFLDKKINPKSSLPLVWDNLNIQIPRNSRLRMTVEVRPLAESLELQLENYKKILESKKFYDVTFIAENKEFTANSNLLSMQSPVFKSMFEADMEEKNNGLVQIYDIEPHILEKLMNFIHRGSFEESLKVGDLLKLLVAADKYCVSSLVSRCYNQISNVLTTDCVVDVLIMADLVNVEELKRECKTFIFQNKTQVIKTDSYKNFIKSHPDLLSELFCEI